MTDGRGFRGPKPSLSGAKFSPARRSSRGKLRRGHFSPREIAARLFAGRGNFAENRTGIRRVGVVCAGSFRRCGLECAGFDSKVFSVEICGRASIGCMLLEFLFYII